MDLNRGSQIIYIPHHAEGDSDHPDCEPGFVVSIHKDGQAAFCRFWRKPKLNELRTKANSELTPLANLVVCDTVPRSQVEAALERHC